MKDNYPLVIFGIVIFLGGIILISLIPTRKCLSTINVKIPQRLVCVDLHRGPTYCNAYEVVEAHEEEQCSEFDR